MEKSFRLVACCGDLVFAALRGSHCSRHSVTLSNHCRNGRTDSSAGGADFASSCEAKTRRLWRTATLGEFYLQQTRLQQGILYLQKAQQLNPQDYNTGYDLSLAYLNSGDIANASTQLHAMIAQRETAELDDLLAEVNEKSGDYKAAASGVLPCRRAGPE